MNAIIDLKGLAERGDLDSFFSCALYPCILPSLVVFSGWPVTEKNQGQLATE